tara:strand:- start:68 stop:337 length:270 start_codon:yes stop_codon:yes gene_type:complete
MSEKAFAIGPKAKYKKMNTLISEIGKIKENKFRVGADLVIIPPARFINNIPPTTGNMIKAVKYNILPNAIIPTLLTSIIFNDIPIGRKI